MGEKIEEIVWCEFYEELVIDVGVGDWICTVWYVYSYFKVTFYVFVCKFIVGTFILWVA